MATKLQRFKLQTTGASNQTSLPLNGKLVAVHVIFSNLSVSGTINLINDNSGLSTAGANQTLLNVTGTTATTWYYPVRNVQDNTGTAFNSGTTATLATPYVIDGLVKLTTTGYASTGVCTVYGYLDTY